MRQIWVEYKDMGKIRDPDRIYEMCEMIKNAWMKVPDQRLGQFLLNYVFDKKNIEDSVPSLKGTANGMYPDRTNALMFNQEDDLTLEILDALEIKIITKEMRESEK